MKPHKLQKKVSHQDVQRALKWFLDDGGLIKHLPDQQTPERPVIGGEKYQNYELLTNLLSR